MSHSPNPSRRARSWLISALLHAFLVLLLVATVRLVGPQGAMAERTAEVGIVLKRAESMPQYERPDVPAEQKLAEESSAETLDGLLASRPQADPQEALPELLGPGPVTPFANRQRGGHSGPGSEARRPAIHGRTTVNLLGVEAKGRKFAFVLDRSESMQGAPLELAKQELIASLQGLESTHQFEVIFYNSLPRSFDVVGRPFATARNKHLAERFIRSIKAFGGTNHEAAIVAAIKTQPDVIFLLADSDEQTPLGPAALHRINRLARGIMVNVIEFGEGRRQNATSFLAALAAQNVGQYRYINLDR